MKCQFYVSYVDYFSCLQTDSKKSFNVHFYKHMFLEIFVAKGDTGQFFEK